MSMTKSPATTGPSAVRTTAASATPSTTASEQCKLCLLAQHSVSNIKKLYEDEDVVLIWYPTIVVGHLALIPKQHYSIMMNVPDTLLQKMFVLVQQFARELLQQTMYEGFTLISNNGIDQAHSHFSLHIIPLFEISVNP